MSQTHRNEAPTTPSAHEVRDLVEREGTAPPAPTAVVVGAGGDPLIVGLPIFAVGSLALGMALIGVVDLTALSAIVPIILAGTGLYLLVCTVWAALLGQTMVAGITGTFSGFWLSLSILLLGLNHNWYGIRLLQVVSVEKLFFIAWAALFFFLLIPCLMLPIVYPAVVALVVVALCLAASSFFAADTNLLKAAGYVALVFSLLGFYAFLNVAFTAMNSKAKMRPPLGKAMIS